ncbi:hypothetical protein HHL24_36395 [Paraburkholderia sp. RP-4-7]|uniref:Porin n=1 Tax=Paraburkholderia polaris TaxID=2728848 RepID=A0A848IM28_9BURK|nr:hypothetical protein [Paraburkholderia polaris]NMM03362.1 hypothetical protein [Paraburkholderia polaris]
MTCVPSDCAKAVEPPSLAASGSASDYRQISHDSYDYPVAGAFAYTDGRDPKWSQISVQASYLLLKCTDVYLQAQVQQIDEDRLDVGADIFGLSTASSSNRQVVVTIGMRHRF